MGACNGSQHYGPSFFGSNLYCPNGYKPNNFFGNSGDCCNATVRLVFAILVPLIVVALIVLICVR